MLLLAYSLLLSEHACVDKFSLNIQISLSSLQEGISSLLNVVSQASSLGIFSTRFLEG